MIDLVVLIMHDFDVIIGMDWLVKERVVIDCNSGVIQFNLVGYLRFKFVENRGGTSVLWISSLEVIKLLDEECQGFPASVVDSVMSYFIIIYYHVWECLLHYYVPSLLV